MVVVQTFTTPVKGPNPLFNPTSETILIPSRTKLGLLHPADVSQVNLEEGQFQTIDLNSTADLTRFQLDASLTEGEHAKLIKLLYYKIKLSVCMYFRFKMFQNPLLQR